MASRLLPGLLQFAALVAALLFVVGAIGLAVLVVADLPTARVRCASQEPGRRAPGSSRWNSGHPD